MKILIISHDASRTGAPILLLNLAKLILKFKDHEVEFLLKNGGDLTSDFCSIAPTYFIKKSNKKRIFLNFLKGKKSILKDKLFLNNFDLIISNTITNGEILETIGQFFSGKIISYIHELEIASKAFSNETSILKLIKNSNSFWVPSSIVNDFLINKWNISQDKIFTMPYYIPNDKTKKILDRKPKKEFIIGACGTIDWRKGADLFIIIANQLFIKNPNASIIFKWAGALPGLGLDRLNYELSKCNLTNKVFFEFASPNLNKFYETIDLFLLPSREDPYPLVILEAAKNNVPSICFDSVCGSKDFIINSNGGLVVPFLDIDATVDTIISFYNNIELAKELGNNANEYLISTHSNDEFVYKIFNNLLEN